MKTKLLFIALIVFVIGGLLLISPVKAATDSVSDIDQEVKKMAELDQEVSAEDLGVKAEPLLLPDSRFYPLKIFWRKVKMTFTFNPIKKVELQQKFANEKLIETIKVYKKNKNPEQAEKLLEKYSEEVGLIAKRIEKIKKSPKNQAGINNLLDNLADHLIKRQKVVLGIQEKLENKLPPEKYEKIAEQLDWTVERLGVKIEQLEKNRESLKERFVKVTTKQKGSEFKNFKNLEILKDLAEKMPLRASEAIEEAREIIKEKFLQDMNEMNAAKRARFKNYINKINGNTIRHLEILKEMESEEIKKEIIEKKEILQEQYSREFCKDLCGDGICQEVVCMAVGCPCAETAESCPEDCN
jgi:hypothetical protein